MESEVQEELSENFHHAKVRPRVQEKERNIEDLAATKVVIGLEFPGVVVVDE